MAAGRWCILRTNSRRTLNLVAGLKDRGIAAWTPQLQLDQRLPRSKVRREKTTALMPSFVFAKAEHIEPLLALSHRPGTLEPFTVFHYLGTIPLIADRDIEPLRLAERAAVPKHKRRIYRPGQAVRVPEGSFEGMRGIVEQSDGQYTLVAFGGAFRVKIGTFILEPDVVGAAAQTAAKAA
jgi:hypothetical protein